MALSSGPLHHVPLSTAGPTHISTNSSWLAFAAAARTASSPGLPSIRAARAVSSDAAGATATLATRIHMKIANTMPMTAHPGIKMCAPHSPMAAMVADLDQTEQQNCTDSHRTTVLSGLHPTSRVCSQDRCLCGVAPWRLGGD